MKHVYIIILSFIIGVLLAALVLMQMSDDKSMNCEKIIIRDTIFEVMPAKHISLEARPAIKHKNMEIASVDTFSLSLDTAIVRDTVQIRYFYPENLLSLRIAAMPDTVAKMNIRIYESQHGKKENIWIERLTVLCLGIGIGATLKK